MAEQERNETCALTVKRKRIMIYFIEATQKLIRTDGVDGLSIRKIANEAGYNSATIYNYFRDLEHLTLFGSVCYLRDYVIALSKSLKPEMSSLDRFRTIYRCFNEIAFQHPDIFHNMFFGRHSEMMGEVLHIYYSDLFPEELAGFSAPLRQMMLSGSMLERDRVTMQDMVVEGFVAPEKADITLRLIVAIHQNFIYEACIHGDSLDCEAHKQKFSEMLEYILAQAK